MLVDCLTMNDINMPIAKYQWDFWEDYYMKNKSFYNKSKT